MGRRSNNQEHKNSRVIDISHARKERDMLKPSRRRGAKGVRKKIFYAIVIILLLMVIVGTTYNLLTLKAEEAGAQAKLDALEIEKEALGKELQLVDSDEYLEQKAREELKMIMPGETLYIVKEKEADQDETPNQ